ncbi:MULTISPECIES: hypothetical protein [unclassified Caballeronia]|uniref:hypothetical protein n=1 Tax=unclassified Caballeronia TaxID=2646786 RepID=UPI001F1FEEE3|nr:MULTISPECIES: hypothetical protein [unclassified Caballeronia]MCE4546383.1 hypothetical protein [Caballeronia sp. PC1]MCE4573142.1 hypothetical protein [Caballeronia sp. CLC5]
MIERRGAAGVFAAGASLVLGPVLEGAGYGEVHPAEAGHNRSLTTASKSLKISHRRSECRSPYKALSAQMAIPANPGSSETPAHRLVIIEGIMGSGKSTTMRFVAKNLQDSGQLASPLHERTDPHPVRATDELEHWFEPWRDATPQHLADRALGRWAAFVEATQRDSPIPVMDGQLFHGDLTHLLLMDAESALIFNYVSALAAIIAPLNPFVLYLWQEDVEQAVRTVCTERGSEWIDYQVNWKLASPYCVRKGYQGFEGLTSLYRDYRRITDDLFDHLPLAKLAIENSRRDWPAYESQILNALQLSVRP